MEREKEREKERDGERERGRREREREREREEREREREDKKKIVSHECGRGGQEERCMKRKKKTRTMKDGRGEITS